MELNIKLLNLKKEKLLGKYKSVERSNIKIATDEELQKKYNF